MIQTIYVEDEVAAHPRTLAILDRFPDAVTISCRHYGEIFNRSAQNFRLQKQRPALVLARKFKNFVLDAPQGYGIGARRNYYFSHMLNCIYDCRYCFLQGMYRSANYVLFVNYEDFHQAISDTCARHADEEIHFFSGYDCDSLALEPVSGFAESFVPLFETLPDARLELRTKSTQVRTLLERQPLPNCIVAFSLSPAEIAEALEHKAPPLERRLHALARLQNHGWTIGLRFDPLIYHADYRQQYRRLFAETFARVDASRLHSVSLGTFRLPESFFRNMVRLYPTERLFAGPLHERDGMVTYRDDLEREMMAFCSEELRRYVSDSKFFPASL